MEAVSRIAAAGILAASLSLCGPDLDIGWIDATAKEYMSPSEERKAVQNRRKDILRAAKEKALKSVRSDVLTWFESMTLFPGIPVDTRFQKKSHWWIKGI